MMAAGDPLSTIARVTMQFICTNCDKPYEISARAFGERQDTRTRCPGCRTWLILTRNPGDQVLATLDPTAPGPAAPNGAPMPGPARRIAPSRAPSSPTAIGQSVTRADPAAATPGDNADVFFAPRLRPGSGAERLGSGMATFALPDPAERLDGSKKRLQMQQVLQDFSVMFKLETRKSGRKQVMAAVAVALLVAAGLWVAVRAKVQSDENHDAAKESKHLLAALVLQGGQGEAVAVLTLPGDPTSAQPTDASGAQVWPGTHVSRQCFLKVRQARARHSPERTL